MKILVIVDMQIDFCKPEGSLYNPVAEKMIPKIVNRLAEAKENKEFIIFTQDTHFKCNYFDTLEGKKLPIPHCILNTKGREIVPELNTDNCIVISKLTFGDCSLPQTLRSSAIVDEVEIEEIEVCGVCTDICLISNCLLLRSSFPNTRIIVNSNLCAGTTKERHKAALDVMKSCQIDVIEED